MKILISGATGLIGTALTQTLSEQGHEVFVLHRRDSDAGFYLQPELGQIHLDSTIHLDVVINLNGANIAEKRWNHARKQLLINSREIPTQLLATTLAQLKQPPKLFISASAIGYYGDRGNEILDESSAPKDEFMSHICQRWEQASRGVLAAGIRLVNIRTGIVLSTRGGALPAMMSPIRYWLGGRIGDGLQHMSWISITDVCRSIRFIIDNKSIEGAVNLVAPQPVTNREFIETLADLMHRPTWLPFPALAARMLFGEMAQALLLSSTRVLPAKLLTYGYRFQFEQLKPALEDLLANHT